MSGTNPGGQTIKYIPYILTAIVGLVYCNTLNHGFVLDDVAVIGQNKFVQQGIRGIPKILTSFYWQGYWDNNSGLYRPLSLIMFALEWQFEPNNPLIHHIVNVLLYVVTITQLYKFLHHTISRYNIWLPAIVTLLFAVHPIHTEVVANIKSSDEILCFLFFLLAANQLLAKGRVTIAAYVCFTLCLLSKEAGLLYLPVFALLMIQFGGKSLNSAAQLLWPLAAVSALWLGWHFYVTHFLSPAQAPYTYADNSLVACPNLVSRIFTGFVILGMYMMKAVWPYSMSYDYSFSQVPCETSFPIAGITALLITAALLFVAVRYFKKVIPVSFGILFFFCTILLASNIIFLIGTTMGERLLFAPVLGVLICICWLVFRLTQQLASARLINPAMLILLAVSIAYVTRTIARNTVWHSNDDLFITDVQAAPNSARVLYNFGTSLLNRLPDDQAARNEALFNVLGSLHRAVTIDTAYKDAWFNLGIGQYRAGQYDSSLKSFGRVLQLNPKDSAVNVYIADNYFMMKRYDDAIALYRQKLATNDKRTRNYIFLGTALFNQQRYDEAIEVFTAGLARDSSNAELWGNYGNVLGMQKRYDDAINAFNRSLQIKPNQKNILYYISLSYKNKGDSIQSAEYLQRAK